ncbi:MAG TPA: PilW family protein [Gallionella sp.]|nr:PilW family protein [Gallionella sp.]
MNSFNHTHAFANRQIQRGLSLIELMISITIGLLILSALSTLFANQSRTRSELDKSNRMIDNGRYALEVLTDNLRLAGFYSNYAPSGTPTATPDPCDLTIITNSATNLNVLRHHVQGYNAAAAASQIASLPASCGFTYTAGSATTLKPGSDILVLRRASTSPVAATAAVAATTYLQVSNCTTDAASYQIAPGTAAFTTFHNKDCTTPASLRPFLVQAYFVSSDNNVGDGIPTLKRRELNAATGAFVTTPLVEGIEYLQIDYGLDANADGAADSYIAAPAAADWPNIVSIKINIIARNIETSPGYTDTKSYALGSAGTFGPFGDAYKRHAYTQVVRLVNPSGRREVP